MKTDHPFRKKWGQNFLADTNLLQKIIRTVDLQPDDYILEIGPGEGALTERILPEVAEMAAVEIDPLLIKHLRSAEHLTDCHFIHADVLWLELDTLPIERPVRVIGNIPYNITSPILFWLIEQREHWADAFMMVQKEVADRLTAEVGTKSYGRLTVMTSAFMDIEHCFTIPPDVFIPRPRVDSAIIRLSNKQNPLIEKTRFNRFESLVKAAFSSRRKMLRNTLKGFDIDSKVIDLSRRPETLTVEEFIKLL
ncbi:MAG: 16S rRNA (adenine(1518)-N(6)/adenine(1519)-N(6))-dimethyltransferase RsmA [Candidatus Marinimicrobia bacterium]|nr:16S rRNA (adenine(1518)-N(6)/adenine(1519)-N(6))-dimethyltransferase RsmA [Candidatus Neomarinimicrobiota bacterium]